MQPTLVRGTNRQGSNSSSRGTDASPRRQNVTRLLDGVAKGQPGAFDQLVPEVYDELRAVAQRLMRWEKHGQTLDTTALVHEAYLKLVDQTMVSEWKGRAHFYGIAARAMRQILVDRARGRAAEKRGGGWGRTTLAGKASSRRPTAAEEVIALNDALERLELLSERQVRIVERRFFGGMSEQEIAESLAVSTRTVEREWVKARAWLYRELYMAG